MRSSNLLEHIFLCLRKYMWVWLVPMIVGFGIALIYNKFLATKTYTARQSLILRDELLGDGFNDPSRFKSQESLKSAQETVLEIARKPQVVRAVLEQLGPSSSWLLGSSSNYPTLETVEDVQGNITLSAPNGGEFGKTEAVVLSVKTVGAERSREFMNYLLDEVDAKLNEVRLLRLGSMQNELSQASENAEVSLKTASRQLQKIEKSFGADITTIRGLNDPQGSGGFDLKLNQIKLEKRQTSAQLASAKKQRRILQQAKDNNDADIVTSEELLRLQPALQGTMTNLSTVMAQLAIDEGRYTSLHPDLIRTRRAVEQQKQQLFNSIGTTLRGLDSQIDTLESLDQRLGDSIDKLENELATLTEKRVPYATLEEEVKKKAQVYNDVQGRLAQVMSYAESTDEIATLTRVDDPQVSSRPDQIGNSMAAMLGGMIGLIGGLGLVVMLAPPFVDPRSPMANPTAANPTANSEQYFSPNSPDQGRPAQPSAGNDFSAPVAPAETSAESRLKSVAAMQRKRNASKSNKSSALAAEPAETEGSLLSNSLDSVVPESIRHHMAAMKQSEQNETGKADSKPVVAQTAPPTPPQTEPQRRENAQTMAISESDLPANDSTNAGVALDSPAGNSAATLAEQIKASQAKLESDSAQVKQANEPAVSAGKPSAETAKGAQTEITSERSKVSSADVAAALSKLQGKDQDKKQDASNAGGTAAQPSTQGGQGKLAVPQRRQAISSFVSTEPVEPAARQPVPPTPSNPKVIPAAGPGSPSIPESVTSGRITAETLLSSKKSDGSDVEASSKFSAEAHGTEDSSGEASSRVPSITDYARSLDQKTGSVGDQSTAEELRSTQSSDKFREKNMRPSDIARLAEDPEYLNKGENNISVDDSNADATKFRKKSDSVLAEAAKAALPVSGILRSAKGSGLTPASLAGDEAVTPAEKSVEKSEELSQRTQVDSTIPGRIKKISDSFSSFARPSDQDPPAPTS